MYPRLVDILEYTLALIESTYHLIAIGLSEKMNGARNGSPITHHVPNRTVNTLFINIRFRIELKI